MDDSAYQRGMPLTAEAVFELVTDEVFRDGVLEPEEQRLLKVLSKALKLPHEKAKAISRRSKKRFKAGALGDKRRFDSRMLYSRVLSYALSDGRVDAFEKAAVKGLFKLFKLRPEDHVQLLAEVQEDPNQTQNVMAARPRLVPPAAPDPAEVPAAPALAPASSPSPTESPPPARDRAAASKPPPPEPQPEPHEAPEPAPSPSRPPRHATEPTSPATSEPPARGSRLPGPPRGPRVGSSPASDEIPLQPPPGGPRPSEGLGLAVGLASFFVFTSFGVLHFAWTPEPQAEPELVVESPVQPTAAPTTSPTATPTQEPAPTPTASATASPAPASTPEPTPVPTASPAPSPAPTPSSTIASPDPEPLPAPSPEPADVPGLADVRPLLDRHGGGAEAYQLLQKIPAAERMTDEYHGLLGRAAQLTGQTEVAAQALASLIPTTQDPPEVAAVRKWLEKAGAEALEEARKALRGGDEDRAARSYSLALLSDAGMLAHGDAELEKLVRAGLDRTESSSGIPPEEQFWNGYLLYLLGDLERAAARLGDAAKRETDPYRRWRAEQWAQFVGHDLDATSRAFTISAQGDWSPHAPGGQGKAWIIRGGLDLQEQFFGGSSGDSEITRQAVLGVLGREVSYAVEMLIVLSPPAPPGPEDHVEITSIDWNKDHTALTVHWRQVAPPAGKTSTRTVIALVDRFDGPVAFDPLLTQVHVTAAAMAGTEIEPPPTPEPTPQEPRWTPEPTPEPTPAETPRAPRRKYYQDPATGQWYSRWE